MNEGFDGEADSALTNVLLFCEMGITGGEF